MFLLFTKDMSSQIKTGKYKKTEAVELKKHYIIAGSKC